MAYTHNSVPTQKELSENANQRIQWVILFLASLDQFATSEGLPSDLFTQHTERPCNATTIFIL